MNTLRTLLLAATAAATLAACNNSQQSGGNTYTIDGQALGFAPGDTLYVVTDIEAGQPTDTIIVGPDGRFTHQGAADSVRYAAIVAAAAGSDAALQFFTESGTITMTLAAQAGKNRVGGTLANDSLQAMTERLMPYVQRIEQYSDSVVVLADDADDSERWAIREHLNQLYNEYNRRVVETAERNKDNELGYFIVTQYDCYDADLNQRLIALIDQMPDAFQQRPALQRLRPVTQLTDFTLNTPEGTPLSIMQEVAQHRITVLDFWASWCGPCRQEMPFMKSLYERYSPQGLGIIGISLDDDGDAWRQAIADLGLAWPQVSDLKGWQAEPAQFFRVQYIPFIVVVDQQGTVLAKELRGEDLEHFVAQQLES